MNPAGDREAEFGLGVVDAVAAGDIDAGLAAFFGRAVEDAFEGLHRQTAGGKGDKIEGEEGLAAHGVDIAEGVGRSDGPEVVWIIDDGGEKIDGLDKSGLVINAVDRRIVAGLGADEQGRVSRAGQSGENLLEALGPQLAGAAEAEGVVGQLDRRGRRQNSSCRRSAAQALCHAADRFDRTVDLLLCSHFSCRKADGPHSPFRGHAHRFEYR